MTVRPIDANQLYRIEKLLDTDIVKKDKVASELLEQVLYDIQHMPTLTPPNEPLTVKQLQKMVGEPVYDYLGQEWYVIQEYYGHELTMTDGTRFFDDDEIDGVDKRFYRRPPEGEEGDANRG